MPLPLHSLPREMLSWTPVIQEGINLKVNDFDLNNESFWVTPMLYNCFGCSIYCKQAAGTNYLK